MASLAVKGEKQRVDLIEEVLDRLNKWELYPVNCRIEDSYEFKEIENLYKNMVIIFPVNVK
ncbi:MAG: hypothetical protein ACOX3A_08080 [bacterium]